VAATVAGVERSAGDDRTFLILLLLLLLLLLITASCSEGAHCCRVAATPAAVSWSTSDAGSRTCKVTVL
jgi:hypothetical protein